MSFVCKNFRYLVIGVAVVLTTACATTTQSGATGVQRKQLMLLPSQQVDSMAAQGYQQNLQAASQKGTLNADTQQLARVKRIADRLIPQTAVFRPDARQWKWEVNVETNDQVNAYCMPGGKIMVYTGLVQKLHATDDELAAVMGHEISHALREHGREQMSLAYTNQLGMAGLAALIAAFSKNDTVRQVGITSAAAISAVALTLPNSREAEREADQMGLELAARAGYNPNGAISLWQKMSALGGNKPPQWLSTHPSEQSRIQALQQSIPKVMPLYKAALAQ